MSKPPTLADLSEAFVIIDPKHHAESVTIGEDFFQQLDRRSDGFRGHLLMSSFSFDSDWSTWERHPAGDEIVILLSGEATLLLELPDGNQKITLKKPGSYVIVPTNIWHTAQTTTPTQMLFLTPGAGTENRAID